jgi:hypothetical protein
MLRFVRRWRRGGWRDCEEQRSTEICYEDYDRVLYDVKLPPDGDPCGG